MAQRMKNGTAKEKTVPTKRQAKNGRTETSYIVGRDSFDRISAVEGIVPSGEARKRAQEFERRGLSAEERRAAIIAVHRPKD